MLKQFAAAVSFLTRMPIAARFNFTAEDVGKSARWFPLVGGLIGLVYAVTARGMLRWFPAIIVAVLIILIEALLTGALHLDGVADMADGFGGGKTREDVLRIMRDHAIGAYGGVALIVIILLKLTAISTLIDRHCAEPYLIISAALGRWSTVLLSSSLPYARATGASVSDFVGWRELLAATIVALGIAVAFARISGIICCLGVAVVSAVMGYVCRARIGGVTGDTLGANVEISEAVVLLMGTVLK